MSFGPTRNLTEKFKELRSHAQFGQRPRAPKEDSATAKLMDAALNGASDQPEGSAAVAVSIPPSWIQTAEQIRTEMQELKRKIGELKDRHSKALLVSFQTDDGVQREVEALTHDIKWKMENLELQVKRITQAESRIPGQQSSDEVVKQVQRQLAQALFKLSVEFRKEETKYLNKLEEQRGYGKGHFGLLVDEASTPLGDEDPGFTDFQQAQVSKAETLVQERDEEIRKIVQTIGDLAQIMKDLSVLVVEQGTILDRIDYNIEKVAEHVESGIGELHKAEKKQKQSRSLLCIVVLMILVFVMTIVVILRKS